MSVAIRPSAEADIRMAVDHYRQVNVDGRRFRADLDQVLERLEMFPESRQTVDGYEPFRVAHLRRFPYSVFYRVVDGDVAVVRVLHNAQSRDRLQGY